MTLRFLATWAEYMVSLTYLFYFVELPQTIFQIYIIFINYFFVLCTTMMQNFIWLCVVIIFNKLWMPFNWNMAFLKEILNKLISWYQNASIAHFHPIALRACIARPIYSFKYKRFVILLFGIYFVHPIWLFPPPIFFDMINWAFFK